MSDWNHKDNTLMNDILPSCHSLALSSLPLCKNRASVLFAPLAFTMEVYRTRYHLRALEPEREPLPDPGSAGATTGLLSPLICKSETSLVHVLLH